MEWDYLNFETERLYTYMDGQLLRSANNRVSSDRENRDIAGKLNDLKKKGNFREYRKNEENSGIFIEICYF